MAEHPDDRLAALGIVLPEPPAPAAAYVPTRAHDGVVHVAGQVAVAGGELLARGVVGEDVGQDVAERCARQCAINVLAQLRTAAGGDLAGVRLLKVGVFVASAPNFTEQHLVANAASELLGDVLGSDRGAHARAAVGVSALPMGSPVEIDAVAALA